MKIEKTQLKEMVRRAVRRKLLEMDLEEREVLPVDDDDDGKMSQDDIEIHLDLEKERTQKKRTQRDRQTMKQTSRGMELECGPGKQEDENFVVDDNEEEYLDRLEKMIFQSEKRR